MFTCNALLSIAADQITSPFGGTLPATILIEDTANLLNVDTHTNAQNAMVNTQPISANPAGAMLQPKLCKIEVETLLTYLSDYNPFKTHFLQLGLVNGFSLHYKGPIISSVHKNHFSHRTSKYRRRKIN
jgi:hypothetical protein